MGPGSVPVAVVEVVWVAGAADPLGIGAGLLGGCVEEPELERRRSCSALWLASIVTPDLYTGR